MNRLALLLIALSLPAPAVEITASGFTLNDEEIALCKEEGGCVMVSRGRIRQLVELRAIELRRERWDMAECWSRL